MLSIVNRRLLLASTSSRSLVVMRAYTVVPSTPQQQEPSTIANNGVKTTNENNYNSVHALYNNENQSLHHEYHTTPGQTYRSLSEDDSHSAFSPQFNSVFDE